MLSKAIPKYLTAIALTGAIIMLGSYLVRNDAFRATLLYTEQAVGFAAIMAYILFSSRSAARAIRKLLESIVFKTIGKLSYSIYLWHLPTLKITERLFGQSWRVAIVAAITTLCLSALSYRFIENPMLAIRRRFGSHAA